MRPWRLVILCTLFVFVLAGNSMATPYFFSYSGVASLDDAWNVLGLGGVNGESVTLPFVGSFVYDDSVVPFRQDSSDLHVTSYPIYNFVLDISNYIFYQPLSGWTFLKEGNNPEYSSILGGMGFESSLDNIFSAHGFTGYWFEAWLSFGNNIERGDPLFVADSGFDPTSCFVDAFGGVIGYGSDVLFLGSTTGWTVRARGAEGAPAPEPSTALLLAGGLALLALWGCGKEETQEVQ